MCLPAILKVFGINYDYLLNVGGVALFVESKSPKKVIRPGSQSHTPTDRGRCRTINYIDAFIRTGDGTKRCDFSEC